MKARMILGVVFAVVQAAAHFVYVTPDEGGATAKLFLSENLTPDLDSSMIGTTKLNLRAADGAITPLTLGQGEKAFFTVPLAGSGTRVIYGVTDLGVMQRGQSKPHWLIYYPKSIVGDAFDPRTRLDSSIPVEIVPVGKPGSVKLLVIGRGKPVANTELTVILPGGEEKKVTTGPNGETEAFTAAGRYGAWARFWESEAGDHNGKKYEEVRHYATIVFDASLAATTSAAVPAREPVVFAKLPEATASFGAVSDGGWLYVYGGHVAPTHAYFREAVSGRFGRLRLSNSPVWEELPAGPALQGLNLTAHNGKIYRVGGMAPRNERGQAADNHSIADAARFDPGSKQWQPLPSLPDPRSSHDVVAVGDKLVVVGGWTLKGTSDEWRSTVEVLDLSAPKLEWKAIPQPFQRRALMTVSLDNRVYVIGGMNEKQEVVRNVSILDPATGQWSEGPELPKGALLGFAPAAGVHAGQLYVSLGDGSLWRLNRAQGSWEKAGQAAARVAHRLTSHGPNILLIGGAIKGKNLDTVEAVELSGDTLRP